MTGNVLDLIDNVVAEHELLSADAMRWAPDAPDPTPDGPLPAEVWDRCIVDETHEWIADQLERRIAVWWHLSWAHALVEALPELTLATEETTP